MADSPPLPERLLRLAYGLTHPHLHGPGPERTALEARLAVMLPDLAERDRKVLSFVPGDPARLADAPDHLKRRLLRLLAGPGRVADERDLDVLAAIVRRAIGHPGVGDDELVNRVIEDERTDEEAVRMAVEYFPDFRGFPGAESPDDPAIDRFRRRLRALFERRTGEIDENEFAYVGGRLILASYTDPLAPGFDELFVEAYDAGFEVAPRLEDDPRRPNVGKPARELYPSVGAKIAELKGGAREPVAAQELAAVTDYVLAHAPVDDNLDQKISAGFNEYVLEGPTYLSLELPDAVTEDTADAELEPENIRSVAMIYAAHMLERAFLFAAVDKATEDWMDGVLTIGTNAGRLFDDFLWGNEDRISANAREIQYERVLGVRPSGRNGRSQRPSNGDLITLFTRFVSGVAEFERRRQLPEVLRTGTSYSDEYVRKAARDLAANASLYGWAYTHFAARRLGDHIRTCVEIIEHPEVQKAYGVQGRWQIVEKVGMDLGVTPNIVKFRTMAATGKQILDLLATKAKALGASLAGTPLFPPLSGRSPSVFNDREYEQLVLAVDNWLAVSGIGPDQVGELSRPTDTDTAPSIPAHRRREGANGAVNGAVDQETIQQLRDMVTRGQSPSLDQLRQMLPGMGV